MAIEKQIKTKISLRYLDYNTWSAESFASEKPLKGEVWFCAIPAGNTNATTAPTMLFKVGDGTNTFGNLKWGSALAADVYGWAKKENLDLADLPDIPVVDEGSGKFVTSVTWDQANNKIVIARDDAVNTLTATDDDVVVLTVDKNKGDVTIDAKHAEKGVVYNGGQAANSINAFGQEITIKVPKLGIDKYGHTNSAEDVEYKISLPTPEAATNTVTTLEEGDGIDIVDLATDGNHHYKVSHEDTSDVANVTKEARKYVAGVTFDDFGHVTAVEMGEETVVDTNTAHTHSVGDGLKKTGDGGIAGDVKYELNVAMKLEDGDIVIYDKDNNNVVARLDAAELLEDSYLNDVDIKDNVLEFTWKMDDGSTKTDYVDLKHLVDVYTGTENEYIKVSVDNYKITAELLKVDTKIIEDKAVTEAKLADEVTTKLNKVWQEVGKYKTEQEAKEFTGSTVKTVTKVTQDKNGEVEVTYTDIAFPDAPVGTGDVAVATKNGDGSVVLNGSIKLNDHTLEDGANEDVTLHKISTTGSIYDVAEGSNAGKDKDGNDILYLILDCNW